MRPAKRSRTFLLDANLFASAVKRLPSKTRSHDLLAALVAADDVRLVANVWLLEEYRRNAARFPSPEGHAQFLQLLAKCVVLRMDRQAVERIRHLIPPGSEADLLHAATSFQAGAILISNDHDFDALAASGLVEVWRTGRAVRELL